MIILGIDPGLTGAIAAWYGLGTARVADTPVIGREYDLSRLASTVRNLVGIGGLAVGQGSLPGVLAVIERQQAMPGQGLVSTGHIMLGYGIWLGVLGALGIGVRQVTPAVWKRAMGLTGKDKDAARALAARLHPEAELHLKKHHGRAEALLLADYGADKYAR